MLKLIRIVHLINVIWHINKSLYTAYNLFITFLTCIVNSSIAFANVHSYFMDHEYDETESRISMLYVICVTIRWIINWNTFNNSLFKVSGYSEFNNNKQGNFVNRMHEVKQCVYPVWIRLLDYRLRVVLRLFNNSVSTTGIMQRLLKEIFFGEMYIKAWEWFTIRILVFWELNTLINSKIP